MPEKAFGWFPVTMERRGATTLIWHASRDDQEALVIVDDQYSGRAYDVVTIINDAPNEFRFRDGHDDVILLRPTVPADAAKSELFTGGIDLPIEVIGAVMTDNAPEPTVAAAVDDAGDVHTMILETALGLYARYARTWIRMTDITPIEQLDIVDVPADDLEHYDQADDRGATVNIRDLNPLERPSISATSTTTPAPSVTAAAVAGTVVVNSPADLPEAIAFAATASGEGARWYVTRRAKALGWAEPLPWEDES